MEGPPTVAVLAPSMFLSVTIEEGQDDETQEIHFHAGGQGIWVARMLAHLGQRPVVCAPLGGESGRALYGLAREWQIELDAVVAEVPSPAYVHDRRTGEREELARSRVPTLNRHDVDELYGRILERSLATGLCVVTGRFAGDDVPTDFYRRLGSDLAQADVKVVGDLHGHELEAFLETGRFDWLKVSDEDLVADGLLDEGDRSEAAGFAVIEDLMARGARGVVLSRSDLPALACAKGKDFRVSGPELEVVDHKGAGDSMTAALTTAVARGIGVEDTLRLAWAAGAANVIRRGLGSANPELIETLATRVEVAEVA